MFIPRQTMLENQFCKYGAQTVTGATGLGTVICYAGSVVYLDPAAVGEDAIVYRYDTYTATPEDPFGFAMQKVKTGYHSVLPTGYMMPGDLGSSDVLAQATVDAMGNVTGTRAVEIGVAHGGIWSTVHYTCKQTTTPGVVDTGDHMKPGQYLYAGCNCLGRVTNVATVAGGDTYNYQAISDVQVARVIKGASASKCTANVSNSALYPIMVKLLV